ncbi:conserved hypothetical protein [Paenibacillus curdlanolyticus YK9]|uniref:Uncharacterized protein n=1 Tax=Paenibacillus curdlanolyticus YK9 TaxID=717606 RepID=E0I4H1_9BACL|nr:hypothetical protein [Paenibacillus curdlanolyticus]EFM12502.1 conserved hypothetical protein [Paenibacillus curdlanolyticus YK9]
MNKKTIFSIIEWLIVVLLLWLCFETYYISIGSSSPEQAHQLSERSFHYGPSNVVRKVEVPFDRDQVIFLGKYKDWFSADTVQRKRGRWVPGGSVAGVPIDRDKAISYSWQGDSPKDSRMSYKFYGYVSDERITAVELLMTDKKSGKAAPLREEIKEDRMFLFLWEAKQGSLQWQAIRGLDKDGKVIDEQKLG